MLDVAKAASAHLDLSGVLKSLIAGLAPRIHFDAVGVVVLDGTKTRLHSIQVDGKTHTSCEAAANVLASKTAMPDPEPPVDPIPLDQHHLSAMLASHQPYISTDLESQRRYASDDLLLSVGVRSYIGLPLVKQDKLIGAIDFLSFEKRDYSADEIQLLQDVSEVVAIAVFNALAYEEIRGLKERLQVENRVLQDEIIQRSIFEEIVGSSTSLKKVLAAIEKVAATDSTVLITGETGTGKELVAHAIHRRSLRSSRALIKVNCAVLPKDLVASELFGHEKGAFTGALQQRIGRFEAADGGTIFLDEIGELSLEIQIALLRVLQEREFERVGGNRSIRTDVRVITATNRDLRQEVAAGRFRMDLYYRLNVFPIHVPPLRERVDDIPVLVDYFIARLSQRLGKRIREIDNRSLDDMIHYPWPGNIRELQNVIERGVILAESEVFRLDPDTLVHSADDTIAPKPGQKAEIEAVLRETHGRISGPDGAAVRLGVAASTLESRIRSLRINKHQFRGDA